MAEVVGTSAGTITSGQRVLVDVATARRVPQYIDKIVNVSMDCAPLYSLIKQVGIKKTVNDAAYFHLEEDWNPISVTIGAGAIIPTTTSFTDGGTLVTGMYKRVNIGTILKNFSTGELMRVSDISGTVLTVQRGHAGTGAAEGTTGYTIAAGEVLGIIGSASLDGSVSVSGISTEPTIKTNYTEIQKQAWELSGRDIESEVYGTDESKRVQKNASEAMMQKWERAILFSNGILAPSSTVAGKTGGLPYWITSNVTNVNGTLNESTLATMMTTFMRRNDGKLKDTVVVAGENFSKALDGFQRDYLRISGDDKIYGVTASTIRSFNGDIKVVRHGMLSSLGSDLTPYTIIGGTSGTDYNASRPNAYGPVGMAYFLNLNKLGIATFGKRDMVLSKDIELPGTDGKKWQYLSDKGVIVTNEKAHLICNGITG